jgi:hypothetical protein
MLEDSMIDRLRPISYCGFILCAYNLRIIFDLVQRSVAGQAGCPRMDMQPDTFLDTYAGGQLERKYER